MKKVLFVLPLLLFVLFGCLGTNYLSAPPMSDPEFDIYPIDPITTCSSADSCPQTCEDGNVECMSGTCMCKAPYKYQPTHQNLSEKCIQVERYVQSMDFGVFPPEYTDNNVKQMIETKSSKKVAQLRKIVDGNLEIVFAMMQTDETCVATTSEFCFCD